MKKLALTDFAEYRYPSALELSPDGRYLTFALKEVDREGDGYRWNLWLYDLERRESRQITRGDDQRKAVWEDNTYILYKTTELDEAMQARGFEEEWTVYHRLNVCTGEECEAHVRIRALENGRGPLCFHGRDPFGPAESSGADGRGAGERARSPSADQGL